MGNQKKRMAGKIYLLVFMSGFFIFSSANAQKNSVSVGLDTTGKYSDNIDYVIDNPTDDYYTLISPSINYSRSTELSDFSMKALVDVIRYQEKSDLNSEDQEYSMTGGFSPSERTRLFGNFFFKDDITLEGELLDTGEVTTRQNRRQYLGRGGGSWQFSERTGVGLTYQFLKKEFESKSSVDYDQHSIYTNLNRYMNNGIDTISLTPAYHYTESDYSMVDNYSLSLGWKHTFSETFQMNFSLGGRFTEEEYRNSGQQFDNTGWIAGVDISRRTETGLFKMGYSRDLWANIGGGQTEVDRITLTMSKWVFRRLGFGLSGSYYIRNRQEDSADSRQTFYRVIPTLDFRLTEKQILGIGYQYDNIRNEDIEGDGTTEVNAVWVELRLTYDRIF